MTNLLILYNPYYQDTVIESHLEVLKQNGKVAFGKVRSKLKDTLGGQKSTGENPLDFDTIKSELQSQKAQNKGAYLQLFITDYANLYVAKVDEILDKSQAPNEIIPNYYEQKDLNVEGYFIITDLREIVRDDFATLRDKYLAGFRTPDFGGHTYAIYGNSYTYPLRITQKNEVDYFCDDLGDDFGNDFVGQSNGEAKANKKYFLNLFKSAEFLAMQENLAHFVFGTNLLYALHPNSFENLIYAELEFSANKGDVGYDFSSVVLRYAKAYEQECYGFVKNLVEFLALKNSEVLEIEYDDMNKTKKVGDLLESGGTLGSYGHLLGSAFSAYINECDERFGKYRLSFFVRQVCQEIKSIRQMRNPVAHGEKANLKHATKIREKVLGIGCASSIAELLTMRLALRKI
ncbi:HP0729 family protein [Helicobacter sp. T3_23-1056]